MRRFRYLFLFPAAVLLLAACSALPPIRPGEGLSLEQDPAQVPPPVSPGEYTSDPLPPGRPARRQRDLRHRDHRSRPLGADPPPQLMTLEGFVLFTARIEGEDMEIERAVSPFTDEAFARSLLRDVMFCLFPPGTAPEAVGLDEGNRPVCRYRNEEDVTTDVVFAGPEQWEIRLYRNGTLTRTLRTSGTSGHGLPKKLELTGHGAFPYRLTLTLLTGTPVRLESRPETTAEEEEDKP